MARVFRTATALAVATAALAGCSEAEPANATLPAATAEPSPTTEELPPLGPADFPMPPEAREKTPNGALAFTRYYMGLIWHIGKGPVDPQPLLDLSRDCRQCMAIAESYRSDIAANYSYTDSSYEFEPYDTGVLLGDTADVGFVYSEGPFEVLDAQGDRVPDRSSGASGDLQSGALLSWDATRSTWIVTELTIG